MLGNVWVQRVEPSAIVGAVDKIGRLRLPELARDGLIAASWILFVDESLLVGCETTLLL